MSYYHPLFGGILIGVAVSLMLYLSGRVAGVSGIVSGILSPIKGDTSWRWFFIGGLILGGFLIGVFLPDAFTGALPTPDWTLIVAGLLVGFGTQLGGGCTSGHGICGISRLSPRSIVATVTFMIAGMLAVVLVRKLGLVP